VNIKTLSAVAIVTAALAAPASAQYERVWGPGGKLWFGGDFGVATEAAKGSRGSDPRLHGL